MAVCPGFELYGKLHLYHVGLLYVAKNYKDPVDSGRGPDSGGGRCDRQYFPDRDDVLKIYIDFKGDNIYN